MQLALPELRCVRRKLELESTASECDSWHGGEAVSLLDVVKGSSPRRPTALRLGWDETALHVLFEVADESPWATLTERDAPLYTEEVVEVFLDPVGDGEMYFEFEVNLNNAVLDACIRRIRSGYRKDFRWRCEGLKTKAYRTALGWNAELAIPFYSVASRPPDQGERWRANFTRIDRPEGCPRELSAWSPTGLAQFHVPSRFGFLEFSV